jgi:large subunit ribosomal protein L18
VLKLSSATAMTSISRCPRALRSRPRTTPRSRSGHRQAEGRPGCRRNPSLAQAGALQGQGYQISRRVLSSAKKGRRSKPWRNSLSSNAAVGAFAPPSRRRSGSRPRLSVHRSGKHIYAQVIDDAQGHTVAAASTLDKDVRGSLGSNSAAAAAVGKRMPRPQEGGRHQVVFDRGGFLFHGRVKALADAAREGGLEF